MDRELREDSTESRAERGWAAEPRGSQGCGAGGGRDAEGGI